MTPEEEKANDAVKIAPHLHHIIFENDKVRVLRVRVRTGGRAEMHWHPENMNYVLAGGKLCFTKLDGSMAEVALNEGQVTYSKSGSHAVENTGDSEVQTVQIEFKN